MGIIAHIASVSKSKANIFFAISEVHLSGASPASLSTLPYRLRTLSLSSLHHIRRIDVSCRLWFAGLTLLALTLIKLVFLDMTNQKTLHRSISFLAVGLLMLVMGYFCLLPSRYEDGEEE